MNSEEKFWLVIIVTFIMSLAFVLVFTIIGYHLTFQTALQEGYEQVQCLGSRRVIWQKVDK